MKYKDIKLTTRENDYSDEIYCSIEFLKGLDNFDNIKIILEKLFKDFKNNVYFDFVSENYIEVRCSDVTLDENGVVLIKKITDKLISLNIEGLVNINVSVWGEKFFQNNEHGKYGIDVVSYEEFIKNIIY